MNIIVRLSISTSSTDKEEWHHCPVVSTPDKDSELALCHDNCVEGDTY